jgi:protein-disulfide isomerase
MVLVLATSSTFAATTKEQVAAAIKENPALVFEALRSNKAQLLEILELAIAERDTLEQKNRFDANLNNPLLPEIDNKRPHLGPLDAPITIVEYSDFLCKYCGQGSLALQELLKRYPGQVRVFFKHYPARPGSIEPAGIFEALGLKSSEDAWKFADLAFANQASISDGSGKGIAVLLKSMKMDYKNIKKQSESTEVLSKIEADVREAKQFGVEGTPTFVVNGILVKGAVPVEAFEQIIQQLMKK